MALYSCLVHGPDARMCLLTAVNHGGDSDSVGSIAGNILGTAYGHNELAKQLDLSFLESVEVIRRISEDLLVEDAEGDYWIDTYIQGDIPDLGGTYGHRDPHHPGPRLRLIALQRSILRLHEVFLHP